MTNIIVEPNNNELVCMYKKASTFEQRALLGYIVKHGFANNNILCGAFNLLCDIQKCVGIYILVPCEDTETANMIVNVAESAILGTYNRYAFSNREITKILNEIKGG